ncbi:baculoviral IAP repeat-containing protein 7-like isoform X2 [Haliotis rubra]|uniref:baculoviral IAP repeat-containing protein 7-like isoform X2 n=1 Tax=Haliotis rubra TaxID=36100 RepID=UPI001EE5F458|nr:baculoviral IAP repeat-containing protein 7-like isoform X2 [Haliotis rubra]
MSSTGIGDKVECERCGLKLLNWTDTDDALHEHATRRTHCPFIVSLYWKLGQTPPPKHPKYQSLQARLDTFVDWPRRYVPKTPEELASAGFFYIGSADRVTCFQCGITLRDWEEEHDPVAEHQKYSEHCQFINKTDLNQLGVATRTGSTAANDQVGVRTDPMSMDDQSTSHTGGHSVPVANSSSDACPIQSSSMVKSAQGQVSLMVSSHVSCHSIEEGSSTTSNLQSAPLECASKGEAEPPPVSDSIDTLGSEPGQQSSQRLVVENKRLREKSTCRVCRNEAVCVLFLPCGHLVTCSRCAPTIADCIVCSKTIFGTVKTFFS